MGEGRGCRRARSAAIGFALLTFVVLQQLCLGAAQVKYNTRKLTRQGTMTCLKEEAVQPVRALMVNGTRVAVSVAYSKWASAMITAEIAYILLSEVMGYEAYLFDTDAIVSAHPVNYAAGTRLSFEGITVQCL